jgi:hypothetical protein
LQIGSTERYHDVQFTLRPVPMGVFMSVHCRQIRNGGLIQVVVEAPEGSSNTGYAAAMDEFIDRALEAEATNIEDVQFGGVRLELEYPLARKPGEEWGKEIRAKVASLAPESGEKKGGAIAFVVNYSGASNSNRPHLGYGDLQNLRYSLDPRNISGMEKCLMDIQTSLSLDLDRMLRYGDGGEHHYYSQDVTDFGLPRLLNPLVRYILDHDGIPFRDGIEGFSPHPAFLVRFADGIAIPVETKTIHREGDPAIRQDQRPIADFIDEIPQMREAKWRYGSSVEGAYHVSPYSILCLNSSMVLVDCIETGFDPLTGKNWIMTSPGNLPWVINQLAGTVRCELIHERLGFSKTDEIDHSLVVRSEKQDLTVASKIFCLISLWHLFRKREEMIGKRLEEGGDGSSFKSVPLAFKGFKMPVVPGDEASVPPLFFLLGDDGFTSHLASSGRELPEASEFAKANLFPLDSSDLCVYSYEVAKKAFVFLLENGFETEDLLRVGRILREFCDEERARAFWLHLSLQELSEALVRDPHEDVTAGERSPYVTPQNLRDTAISLWPEEKAENFHDPACGLGGFLLGALDRASSSAADNFDFMRFSGSDSDASTLSLCKMLFLLRATKSFEQSSTDVQYGLVDLIGKVAPNFRLEDSLSKLDSKKAKKRDFVACDPPFDEVAVQGADSDLIHHFFVRLVVEGLADGGSAAIVLPHSYLKSERDADSRRHLLETGLLEKVMESEPGDSEGRSVVLFLSDDSSEDTGEGELSISFSGLGALAGAAVAAAAKTMPVVAATVAAVSAYKTFRKPKDILEDPNCPIEPHLDVETASRLLNESPLFKFSDWPCEEVPKGAGGVYQIFDEDKLIYVGSSGIKTFQGRLKPIASGRRAGDATQFCVNLCDRLILPTLDPDQMKKLASGELNLDQEVKKFVGERLSFKFFISPSQEFARDFQSHLLSLADPEHLLNPDPQ